MAEKKQDVIDQRLHDLNNDGVDRRGFPEVYGMGGNRPGLDPERGDFTFVQISDSHIGFDKPANPDVIPVSNALIPDWQETGALKSQQCNKDSDQGGPAWPSPIPLTTHSTPVRRCR